MALSSLRQWGVTSFLGGVKVVRTSPQRREGAQPAECSDGTGSRGSKGSWCGPQRSEDSGELENAPPAHSPLDAGAADCSGELMKTEDYAPAGAAFLLRRGRGARTTILLTRIQLFVLLISV